MPIYMDRHDVSDVVTAENVAQLHQEDLKIQDQFNCNGLTYWFDDKRKTAFCLIEAPDENHIKEMHKHAHGEVPHEVIEVDPNIVESFLGRIEDPSKAKNTELNIINDPAFRIIMLIQFDRVSLTKLESNKVKISINEINTTVYKILESFNGSIAKQDNKSFLVSFNSVSNAVEGALQIQSALQRIMHENNIQTDLSKIGLSSGSPVTGNKSFFEEAIKLARNLSDISSNKAIITEEVKDLYKSENQNKSVPKYGALILLKSDENFIKQLMNFIDLEWKNSTLKVDDFNKHLGLSKSQLYRKMILLTGESPNTFLRKYRLNKAWDLIDKQSLNISEIAYDTGFSSLSYFSKCFLKQFGLLPSNHSK